MLCINAGIRRGAPKQPLVLYRRLSIICINLFLSRRSCSTVLQSVRVESYSLLAGAFAVGKSLLLASSIQTLCLAIQNVPRTIGVPHTMLRNSTSVSRAPYPASRIAGS